MKELVLIASLVLILWLPFGFISNVLATITLVQQGTTVLTKTKDSAPITIGTIVLTPQPTVGTVTGAENTAILPQLIAAANGWLSPTVHYLWGGCTHRGVDCSCLVQNILNTLGIHVPRTTVEQKAVDRPVPRDQLRVGDTLFFDNTCQDCGANPTHEGMVIDAEKGLMIDAGDPVKVESYLSQYWQSKWDSAGRAPGL